MTTKLTDEQVNTLWDNFVCPKCGSGDGMDNYNKRYFCLNEDGTLCWEGTSRDLVEAALKRAGIEVAEPWRVDEPPEGTRVELRHRSGWIAEGTFTTSYRNGDLHRMRNGVSFVTDFENFRWRPIGSNPFDQEQT